MTEKLLKTDTEASYITYRHYESSDNQSMINLEDEAPQQRFFRTIHLDEFDFRCKEFEEHIILVAEAQNNSNAAKKICAGVCAGVKNVFFQGKHVKAAVMFDLRVSNKFQRRGIGENLCKKLEEECLKRGINFLYLSVNANNEKAIKLYRKLGYEIFSNRKYDIIRIPQQTNKISSSIKINSNGQDHEVIFENLSKQQAIKLYTEHYGNMDLAPYSSEDWWTVYSRSNFVGTFIVKTPDEKNIVGLSLSKFPYSGYMGIRSLLFPSEFYSSMLFLAISISLLSYGLKGPIESLQNSVDELEIGGFWKWILKFFSFLIPSSAAFWLFLAARDLFVSVSGLGRRGRIFAPFSKLQNENLKGPMFDALMAGVKRSASNEYLLSVIYNRDITDKYVEHIVKQPGFLPEKKFMGKYIGSIGAENHMRDYMNTEMMFFDFRDV